MPVVFEDSRMGWMQNARLYVAPAHIDHRASGNYRYALDRNGHDNCHALLVSAFHQPDKAFADITPDRGINEIATRTMRRNPAAQTQGHKRPRHRH
jgi:hypothetical protein